MRIGCGYDVHALVPDRKLILGGVEIPSSLGLLGHSDADVASHAIIDALLGAAGLGDIGKHFPDTDPRYLGVSSMALLKGVHAMLQERGYQVNNVDTVIVAERPKLAPYIDAMCKNIASALHIDRERVNVKATTTERLGFTGREEGMAAYAVVTLRDLGRGNICDE
ncbi:MAG: 2-C-methyl-D-erythritol 2,4-cyclodiphosphate synthase [Dehalobacterium sp.]